jgi:hypothetical protein
MKHSELDFLFNMFVVCSFLLELKEMGWNLMLPNVRKNHPYQKGIKQYCGYIHKTLIISEERRFSGQNVA